MIREYCRLPVDHEGPCEVEGTPKPEAKPTLKCETCGAEAYPTPTGWQCAAYSNHKVPLAVDTNPEHDGWDGQPGEESQETASSEMRPAGSQVTPTSMPLG